MNPRHGLASFVYQHQALYIVQGYACLVAFLQKRNKYSWSLREIRDKTQSQQTGGGEKVIGKENKTWKKRSCQGTEPARTRTETLWRSGVRNRDQFPTRPTHGVDQSKGTAMDPSLFEADDRNRLVASRSRDSET